MMNNNGRPLSRKQTVRLLIALTILAWATQTLLRQWGFGAEIPTTQPDGAQANQPEMVERFVPARESDGVGAILELRPDATVIGGDVKLRQICRWSDRDKTLFDPIGDLVLVRLAPKVPFKSISIQEIRGTLRDAGVNTATINFAGATLCTVARSDVQYDEKNALDQWITVREGASQDASVAAVASPKGPSAVESGPASMPVADAADPINPVKSLRETLIADLATRLNLPADSLQVDFKAEDEKALNISQPLFRFNIEPVRVKGLGNVSWNVTISGGGKDTSRQKVTIAAEARAWQSQLVVSKPLAARQVIRNEDLVQRRTLVEELSADPLVTMEQSVGQLASRELKPGTILTGRMIDPVQLVKVGQFVTITLDQGTVRVKTVARAMEAGTYGQTIRVKNEATKDMFQVIVTGPQTATMNLTTPVASVGQQ